MLLKLPNLWYFVTGVPEHLNTALVRPLGQGDSLEYRVSQMNRDGVNWEELGM